MPLSGVIDGRRGEIFFVDGLEDAIGKGMVDTEDGHAHDDGAVAEGVVLFGNNFCVANQRVDFAERDIARVDLRADGDIGGDANVTSFGGEFVIAIGLSGAAGEKLSLSRGIEA